MQYKELLYTLTLTVLAVVGLPLLAYLITTMSAFLRSKAAEIKSAHARQLVEEAINAVEQAVLYVMQTYVDSLKRSGAFDKEAQYNALTMAKEKAHALISDDMVNAIESGYGGFETWLDTRIEQTVRATKQ